VRSNFDVISLTTLSGAFHLCFDFVMTRTKTTARRPNVDNRLHVKRHRCHFPGCDRMFAFRQGMSRHMRLVHKVPARDYKGGAYQPKEETVFLAEGEVIDAFRRNDDGLAEALLAERHPTGYIGWDANFQHTGTWDGDRREPAMRTTCWTYGRNRILCYT